MNVNAAPAPGSGGVRPYAPRDAAELGRLYRRAFGERPATRFFERWNWEFRLSPALDRYTNLVADKDGEVVAHLGLLPTRVAVDGHLVPAAFLTDFVADGSRGGILALQLVSTTLSQLPVILHFGGEPVAKRIFERLGMRPVPIGECLVRVEHPDGALAGMVHRLLRRRHASLAGALRRWMFILPGALLSPFCARRYRWGSRLGSASYVIERVDRFDERFDELGRTMRRLHRASCLRDRAFFDWRYAQSSPGHVILTVTDASGQLAAASVLWTQRFALGTYGKVMECLHRDEESLRAIIDASNAALRELGVDFTLAVGLCRDARELLRESGFQRIGEPRPFRLKANVPPDLAAVLSDPDQWYISPGDGDEDFPEAAVN